MQPQEGIEVEAQAGDRAAYLSRASNTPAASRSDPLNSANRASSDLLNSAKMGMSGGLQALHPPEKGAPSDQSDGPDVESDDVEREAFQVQRLLRADFVANLLLFFGGAFFVAFQVREMIDFCERDTMAMGIYLTASICFILSGAIQYYIDFAWTRSIRMGRYTTNRWLNLFITILFVCGIVADVVAFLFWEDMKTNEERIAQWVGNHLWFIAAVLVIVTNFRTLNKDRADIADFCGNLFFLWEATMNISARYATYSLLGEKKDPNAVEEGPLEPNDLESMEIRFELAAAIFWTCNAFCYLCGNVIRVRQQR